MPVVKLRVSHRQRSAYFYLKKTLDELHEDRGGLAVRDGCARTATLIVL